MQELELHEISMVLLSLEREVLHSGRYHEGSKPQDDSSKLPKTRVEMLMEALKVTEVEVSKEGEDGGSCGVGERYGDCSGSGSKSRYNHKIGLHSDSSFGVHSSVDFGRQMYARIPPIHAHDVNGRGVNGHNLNGHSMHHVSMHTHNSMLHNQIHQVHPNVMINPLNTPMKEYYDSQYYDYYYPHNYYYEERGYLYDYPPAREGGRFKE